MYNLSYDLSVNNQKFQDKQNIAKQYLTKKVKKQEEQVARDTAPKTLREMLMAIK